MMTPPSKWKVAAYLTAIFAAGMVSGWVVANREAKTNHHPPHPPGPGPGFGGSSTPSIYQVGLSPGQKAMVDEIIARYRKMWEARMNEARTDSNKRNEELAAVLTPEQRAQWEKIRKDREAARFSGTNSTRGSPSGDKGDRGQRSRSREKHGPESTNSDGGRGVTNPPATESTTPSAPPR